MSKTELLTIVLAVNGGLWLILALIDWLAARLKRHHHRNDGHSGRHDAAPTARADGPDVLTPARPGEAWNFNGNAESVRARQSRSVVNFVPRVPVALKTGDPLVREPQKATTRSTSPRRAEVVAVSGSLAGREGLPIGDPHPSAPIKKPPTRQH